MNPTTNRLQTIEATFQPRVSRFTLANGDTIEAHVACGWFDPPWPANLVALSFSHPVVLRDVRAGNTLKAVNANDASMNVDANRAAVEAIQTAPLSTWTPTRPFRVDALHWLGFIAVTDHSLTVSCTFDRGPGPDEV
jgi:hypothetical protein